jgi:CPA2 family monovalent cation:H+ antiporter-2
MAGQVDLSSLKDAILVLGTAGVVVPLMHRLKVSPIIGFLAAGAILGPKGLGQFSAQSRIIDIMTVDSPDAISGIAEFGIVFLLFVIGLELSLERLSTMRRLVFGFGGAQVLVTTIALGGLLAGVGVEPNAALVLGSCLALSSTAIVVEILAESRRLTSTTGRATFSVLLFQDLAVIPILFLVGQLGATGGTSVWSGLAGALALAVGALGAIVFVGRLVLRPLFHSVAETNNPELFMAATLLVVLATGVGTQLAGMSMALGAFVAGLLLAETEYRRAIEATIEPFKGLLLGVFFFSIGMEIDIVGLLRDPLPIFAGAILLMAVKGVLSMLLARLFRLSWPAAIESAALIAPGGEFAFIVIGLAAASAILPPHVAELAVAVVTLTMVLLPGMAILGRAAAQKFARVAAPDPVTLVAPPESAPDRTIVVGYGRVGEVVAGMLERHRQPYIAIDRDATTVTLGRRRNRPVYYGDFTSPAFLKACGIDRAKAIIVTTSSTAAVDAIVAAVQAARADILIVARARDAQHAMRLYSLGVTDAVPETIEASLQLSEAALVGLGVPMGPVIASIHDKRDEFRQLLKKAKSDGQ